MDSNSNGHERHKINFWGLQISTTGITLNFIILVVVLLIFLLLVIVLLKVYLMPFWAILVATKIQGSICSKIKIFIALLRLRKK